MEGLRDDAGQVRGPLRRDPRIRHFRPLGWSIALVALDVVPSRTGARMLLDVSYGFGEDDLRPLRARRLTMDGEPERTWWVFGIPRASVERESGRATRSTEPPVP